MYYIGNTRAQMILLMVLFMLFVLYNPVNSGNRGSMAIITDNVVKASYDPQVNAQAIYQEGSQFKPIIVLTATTDIMINTISYGNEEFLIGGQNTTSFPMILIYRNGSMINLGNQIPSTAQYVFSSCFLNGSYYIGGSSLNNVPLLLKVDSRNLTVTDMSGVANTIGSGDIYALTGFGDQLFIGGYHQGAASSGPLLFILNLDNDQVIDLSGYLPQSFGQVLSISYNSGVLLVTGVYEDVLLNLTNHNYSLIAVPQGTLADLSSAPFGDGFLTVGSSLRGGQLLYIGLNGTVKDLSSILENMTYEVITISRYGKDFFLGGWGIDGSFAGLFNPYSLSLSRISMPSPYSLNGSEILASAGNVGDLLIGGSIVTQYSNASGAILYLMQGSNLINLSMIFRNNYERHVYGPPPMPKFFIYAVPNFALPGQVIKIIGQDLRPGSTAILSILNNSVKVQANATGSFMISYVVPRNAEPGDVVIKLINLNNTYYNYLGILNNFSELAYGAVMPHLSGFGYSLLRYGIAVPYGNYVEFIRINRGCIPLNSWNYLVQWIDILYNSSYRGGWHPAPNPLDRSTMISINPLTIFYSPWQQGISMISPTGQFIKTYPSQDSYLYINCSLMISWIPSSYINKSSFQWDFDTDYVQNAPYYTPAFRLESGEAGVANYSEPVLPSIINSTAQIMSSQPDDQNL